MVFDPELFEKAGVEIPDTWYLGRVGRPLPRIHDKLGIFGAGGNFQNEHIFKTWLKEHGLALQRRPDCLGYEDDQLYVDFFKMLLGLQKSGAMPTLEWEVA